MRDSEGLIACQDGRLNMSAVRWSVEEGVLTRVTEDDKLKPFAPYQADISI